MREGGRWRERVSERQRDGGGGGESEREREGRERECVLNDEQFCVLCTVLQSTMVNVISPPKKGGL